MVLKPLQLRGHERAIVRVRINRDGDLLFSAAKDKWVNVWFAENGERLGTYEGHDVSAFERRTCSQCHCHVAGCDWRHRYRVGLVAPSVGLR